MERSAPPPLQVARYRRRRLPAFVDRAVSIAVVDGDNAETQRSKRLVTGVLWATLFTGSASAYQFWIDDAPLAAATIAAILATSCITLLAMWARPAVYPGILHLPIALSILTSVALMLMYGGFLESGANAIWGLMGVLGAVVFFADIRSVFWLVFFAVVTASSSAVATRLEPLYALPDPELTAMFNLLVVATFVFVILYYFVRQRARLLRQSDDLVRNILPDEIAERLKTSDEMIAEDFESASILFADVVGFTPLTAEMTPAEMVTLLNDIFSGFDALVEARGLEKIKTIGDAYMVAAGVPLPHPDHAREICDLALAMQEVLASSLFGGRRITFRIGINSGPVVAGIIGRKKFSYDLWGDSVNTASRMESAGSPGRIQTTDATRHLAEADFVFEDGGTIEVKGKGPMRVWHLAGRR